MPLYMGCHSLIYYGFSDIGKGIADIGKSNSRYRQFNYRYREMNCRYRKFISQDLHIEFIYRYRHYVRFTDIGKSD